MRKNRRIAAAAAVSTLAVAGAISAFALTAGTAKADTQLGNCQITSSTAGTPQTCSILVNGFTKFAVDTPQTMTLSGSVGTTGDDVTASWTSQCFDNNGQPLNSGQSGSFEFKSTTLLIFATQVDAQDMSLTPAYCDVTAKLTANNAIAGSDTAKLALSVAYQTTPSPTASPTPSPSPSATATKPSGGGGMTGIVRGFDGKCLDDITNSSTLRATVAIWSCNSHDQAQVWTYAGGELKHNGLCLNAKGNAKNGSKLILWTCNGAPNEIWVFNTINHQVLLRANGYSECINDPGYSTKNGTQLIVWSCVNTPNEHWSTP